MKKLWRPILAGFVVALLLFTCAMVFSAGGHNLVFLMIAFPWAMLLSIVLPQLPWWPAIFTLFALEGPFYGFIIGSFHRKRFAFWSSLSLVLILHLLAVVWCFVFDPKQSWRILFR